MEHTHLVGVPKPKSRAGLLLIFPYLCADKCWSDVYAGWVWLRNPVLVNLYKPPDALQQLWLIKGLEEGERQRKSGRKRQTRKVWWKAFRLNIRGERDWVEIVAQVSVRWQKLYFLHHCHLSCHQYTHSFLLLSNLFLHIHLTGRQALLAELAMRFMLSIGLKRRSLLSSPRYAFNPSNSWLEEKKKVIFLRSHMKLYFESHVKKLT